MALIHKDFVEETTSTTGTGTLDLAGATLGNTTFASEIGDGNTCIYAIAVSDGTYEVGIGTVTDASPDTLSRDTILDSSTGSVIDLPAGTHTVYCTFPALGGEKAFARMISGFIDRTSTTLSFDHTTRIFSLVKVSNFRVWSYSIPYTFTSTQTVEITNATNMYYVYFDNTGTLVQSTTVWDLISGAAPVATVYFNTAATSEYIISDERHSYLRNPISHKNEHLSVGAYLISGLSGTFGDTNGSISIASGSYGDEDIVHTYSGATSQGRIVYRASGAWRIDSATSDIRKVGTYIQYDNAGTLTDVPTNNNYVNYWVYAVPKANTTDAGEIHVLVGQAYHGTSSAALAELPDSLTLPPWIRAEGRLLYRVTYQRTVATPYGDIYQTPTDFRFTKISGGVTLSGSFLPTTLPEGYIWFGNASGNAEATLPGDAISPNDIGAISPSGTAGAGQVAFWAGTTSLSGSSSFYYSNGQLSLSGNLSVGGSIYDPYLDGYTEEGLSSLSSYISGGTLTIPLDGRTYEGVLTGDVSLAVNTTGLTGAEVGHAVLVVEQDANGYDITSYPATWYWPDGTEVSVPATSTEKLELILTRTPSGDIHAAGRQLAVPA